MIPESPDPTTLDGASLKKVLNEIEAHWLTAIH
jgi:hypothetical protein